MMKKDFKQLTKSVKTLIIAEKLFDNRAIYSEEDFTKYAKTLETMFTDEQIDKMYENLIQKDLYEDD